MQRWPRSRSSRDHASTPRRSKERAIAPRWLALSSRRDGGLAEARVAVAAARFGARARPRLPGRLCLCALAIAWSVRGALVGAPHGPVSESLDPDDRARPGDTPEPRSRTRNSRRLREVDLPVVRGFTHGRDRFVVVLEGEHADQVQLVREAAERSIRRILDGERTLAYQLGCGTSEVVSSVTLWLVYVTSMLFSLAVGGSAPIFVAVSVIVFRFWLASKTALGLLAQRLFTVSTDFVSASVIEAQAVTKVRGLVSREGETWFEIVVHVRPSASTGDLVSPGALA
jgi:hypothetical protein